MADIPEQTIEVDSGAGEEFSDYESEAFGSDTTSLITAAKNHVFENGRRFHGWHEGQYAMPNDEEEQDRMDMQHHICLLALKGRLYAAPALKNPQKILDLGTGTGIWAIDAGDFYPEAQVVGVDLSPIQPEWVPPNVSFEVDDIEQLWSFQDNSFDFIHMRQLTGFISDWPKLYSQALRVLKPGGWLEIGDFVGIGCDDASIPKDSYMFRWFDNWVAAMATVGRTVPRSHKDAFISIGFENVVHHPVKLPIGPWAKDKSEKEIGIYMRQQLIEGAESITMAVLTRFLQWKKNEVDLFLTGFRRDLKNTKYHAYTHFYSTYGRKPLEKDC